MNYQLIKEIDLLNNQKLVIWLNVYSLLIFLGLLIAGALVFPIAYFSFNFIAIGLFCIVFLFTLVIHELIHGLFFKLFKPSAKVKFGFKSGMAYATSPGSMYNKSQFFTIIIMPFVLISFMLFIIFLFGVNGTFLYFLFAMHAGGCIGDFYFCYLISIQKNDLYIEDTAQGITFYTRNK